MTLMLTTPACPLTGPFKEAVEAALLSVPGVARADVALDAEVRAHRGPSERKPVEGVKNIIAVASNKGGVGKSTVATNLAIALARHGAKVGILDADITGPNIPTMMGFEAGFQAQSEGGLKPTEKYGVVVCSIGFALPKGTPVVWRGPMIGTAVRDFLHNIPWGELDYLIVDLPPGTGDIQLTLAQKVPVTGAVIVTTPQDIALIDARKGLKMFEKVGIPILGVVENMSFHVCRQCGHQSHIFGAGGAERMCKDYGTELLGQLPLDASIREQADSGKPTVVSDPDGQSAEIYRRIARRCAVKIAELQKDMTSKFPNIVVQNT
jgi:ATP-binding protein involved in chromosome partitioning